jgi:hypothetical protein
MGKKSKSKPTGRNVKSGASAPGAPEQVEQPRASIPRSDCSEFKLGDRITLKDLVTSKYNGKHGTVSSLPTSGNCRYGIRIDGSKAAIAIRPQNIASANESYSRKTTQQLRGERDQMLSLITLSNEEKLNADQLRMMNMMTNMFMTEEQQFKMYGRKIQPIPDFRAELMEEGGGFPTGVDNTWAHNYLCMSFETASLLPHFYELLFKGKDFKPDPTDYMKRLGTNARAKLDWYFGAVAPGSIFLQRTVHPYTDSIRHSFSNQAYRQEKLYPGTTHVAVGFVDLGILFAADLSGPPNKCDGPLHFLGIDMSAYAVAKTHVLWELLKQTPSGSPQRQDHLRRIMQVWYSSTWGEGTECAVKAALSALCSSKKSFLPSVRELLNHWAGKPEFPLKSARTELAAVTTEAFSAVGHLLNKRDRIAMAKYELTRDFGVFGAPVCGNTLMFDCPDGTPPLNNDETVFSALDLRRIMNILRRDKLSEMTIIEAAEEYALGGIAKLAAWAQSEQVSLDLMCARIQDVLDDVAARKPLTMSWSNLPDYVDYAEFHNMARRCSVHSDTVHYGYSMNWVLEVFGVNIIDYSAKEHTEMRALLIEAVNESVETCYRIHGWEKHFRLPPPTNPINTTSQGLELLHYAKWANYFFDIARRGGPCQVGNLEHAIKSPMCKTGSSTVAFTWTYDPEITFHHLLV